VVEVPAQTHEVVLADLVDADEIRITDNLNREHARVSDPEAIRRLADWLGEHEDGWYVPRDGVRIVRLRLNFYRDEKTMGSVGLGRKYLVAQRRGTFAQRDAAPGDRAEALAILGVDDPEA
jgi:hypothetical protein